MSNITVHDINHEYRRVKEEFCRNIFSDDIGKVMACRAGVKRLRDSLIRDVYGKW